MATELYQVPGQWAYNGVQYAAVYHKEVLDQLPQFEFHSQDVLLPSYLKSGRVWLEEVTWLLMNNLDYSAASKTNVRVRICPLELKPPTGPSAIETFRGKEPPRVMSTFQYNYFYKSQIEKSQPRVIYMIRNPKDVLAAYFNFYRMCKVTGNFTGTWDQFFDIFKAKKLNIGDWFDHVLGWWNHGKDKENFLFVKYEDAIKDSKQVIQKIAEFLKKDISDSELDKLTDHVSFENMKDNPMTNMKSMPFYDQSISPFMRKGTVGDWKNYFSPEQNEYVEKLYHDLMGPAGMQVQFE